MRSRVFVCFVFSSKLTSTTFTFTLRVSPARNSGWGLDPRSAVTCSASSCCKRFMVHSGAKEGAPYSLPFVFFIEGPEVGAAKFCQRFRGLASPAGDFGMVAGGQHGRDIAPLERLGSCVMGVFEEA